MTLIVIIFKYSFSTVIFYRYIVTSYISICHTGTLEAILIIVLAYISHKIFKNIVCTKTSIASYVYLHINILNYNQLQVTIIWYFFILFTIHCQCLLLDYPKRNHSDIRHDLISHELYLFKYFYPLCAPKYMQSLF